MKKKTIFQFLITRPTHRHVSTHQFSFNNVEAATAEEEVFDEEKNIFT